MVSWWTSSTGSPSGLSSQRKLMVEVTLPVPRPHLLSDDSSISSSSSKTHNWLVRNEEDSNMTHTRPHTCCVLVFIVCAMRQPYTLLTNSSIDENCWTALISTIGRKWLLTGSLLWMEQLGKLHQPSLDQLQCTVPARQVRRYGAASQTGAGMRTMSHNVMMWSYGTDC